MQWALWLTLFLANPTVSQSTRGDDLQNINNRRSPQHRLAYRSYIIHAFGGQISQLGANVLNGMNNWVSGTAVFLPHNAASSDAHSCFIAFNGTGASNNTACYRLIHTLGRYGGMGRGPKNVYGCRPPTVTLTQCIWSMKFGSSLAVTCLRAAPRSYSCSLARAI